MRWFSTLRSELPVSIGSNERGKARDETRLVDCVCVVGMVMYEDVLTPTLAYTDARELCVDIAALFAGSSLELAMPPASMIDEYACLFYDEHIRVQLTMKLPSLPTMLPAPIHMFSDVHTLDDHSVMTLPPLLVILLSSLHVSLRGSMSEEKETRTPASLFIHYWQRLPSSTDFVLRRSPLTRIQRPETEAVEPFLDKSFVPGITYDTQQKSWVVRWTSDVNVPYTMTDLPRERMKINAMLQLRLELALLAAQAQAAPPQMPFHYSSNRQHPFAQSSDPYIIDVDLLSDLADTVKVPDETPEQRMQYLSKRLTMMPLSMLSPGVLGTDITAPWGEASSLSSRLNHIKELEAAARASDADISLAPLSHSARFGPRLPQRQSSTPVGVASKPREESATMSSTTDIATLASQGPVSLTSMTHVFVVVCASTAVRMRTLSRTLSLDTSDDAQSVVVCIELDGLPMTIPFWLHALHLDMGERSDMTRETGFMSMNDPVQIVIEPLPGHASSLPVCLGRHAQHNMLYTVRLRISSEDLDAQTLARQLTTWDPHRSTRVTMLGTPERGPHTSAHSTCVSQWNGFMDLSLALLDLQRRSFAEHIIRRSMGQIPKPWTPDTPPPPTAGDASLAPMALLASRNAEPVRLGETISYDQTREGAQGVSIKDADGRSKSTTRHAVGWSESHSQRIGFDPTRVSSFASCLLASLKTYQEPTEAGSHRIHICIALSNVSPDPMDIQVSWAMDLEPAPQKNRAIVAEHSSIRVGYVY